MVVCLGETQVCAEHFVAGVDNFLRRGVSYEFGARG